MARSDDGKFKSGASFSSKNLFFVSGKRPSGPEIYEHEAKQHRVSKKKLIFRIFHINFNFNISSKDCS